MTQATIGIDFGTTTSSMAWVDPRTGEAKVLKNAEGEERTPSVVYFGEEGEPLVGTPAEQMLEDPDEARRVVVSVKRELVNDIKLALPGNRRVSHREVAAAVFAKLRCDAEELHFQAPVTRAVVTCPAAFDIMEREAIAKAAQLGGFEEVRLVEEPVAAALAYRRNGLEVGRHVLVYDLGGGTFDLALLRESEDGFELAMDPKGLRRCGGDDFDALLYDHCEELALQQWGEPLDGAGRDLRFLRVCRRRKENLSAHDKALFSSLLSGGRIFKHSLSRADFEALIAERVATTVRLTGELAETATAAGCPVETLVLIGGSSRIPLIQRELAAALPVAPRKYGEADVAVALGAAYGTFSQWRPDVRPRDLLADRDGSLYNIPAAPTENESPAMKGSRDINSSRLSSEPNDRTQYSYYVGIEGGPSIEGGPMPSLPGIEPELYALCIARLGMRPGEEAELPMEYGLVVGEPITLRFLRSSVRRHDPVGIMLEKWEPDELEELEECHLTLRACEHRRGEVVAVRLKAVVNPVGKLRLEAASVEGQTKWDVDVP